MDGLPLWASVYAFAEQFGLHPDDAAARMNLQVWQRWQWLEKANAARRANELARRADDWTKDLSPQERNLIAWALDDVEEESNE